LESKIHAPYDWIRTSRLRCCLATNVRLISTSVFAVPEVSILTNELAGTGVNIVLWSEPGTVCDWSSGTAAYHQSWSPKSVMHSQMLWSGEENPHRFHPVRGGAERSLKTRRRAENRASRQADAAQSGRSVWPQVVRWPNSVADGKS
jgi:hypothetical protein